MNDARSIVIGVGNPLLSDDGVGISIVRVVAERLMQGTGTETLELNGGGLRLMEAMAGFDRAFVVDAMVTGERPGTVRTFSPADFAATRHAASPHDADLATSLAMGRALGMPLPRDITVWGVEAQEVDVFGEELSPAVAAAVPAVAAAILDRLASMEDA